MYFRLLENLTPPEWYATTSAGNFAAAVKRIPERPDKWGVYVGSSKAPDLIEEFSDLEKALHYVIHQVGGQLQVR